MVFFILKNTLDINIFGNKNQKNEISRIDSEIIINCSKSVLLKISNTYPVIKELGADDEIQLKTNFYSVFTKVIKLCSSPDS